MPSFDARLHLPGQSRIPLGVEVDVGEERITVTFNGKKVVDWDLADVKVECDPDGFHLTAEGEEMVLNVADTVGFARELNVETPAKEDPQVATQPARPVSSKSELILELTGSISELRSAITSDIVPPEVVFARWLSLLKRLNQLHGRGKLESWDFYRLNSRLLDLMPEPSLQPETTSV